MHAAQQQRAVVADFVASVQRSMEEELAAHEAAAAAQSRLKYARARLEELRAINAERQRRADEAAAEAARLQGECQRLAEAREAARQEVDRLAAAANAPTPARGQPSADRLIDAAERLDIVAGLQPFKLARAPAAPAAGAEADGAEAWLLRFRLGLSLRVTVEAGGAAALEVVFEPPAGTPAPQAALLRQLAATVPGRAELPARALRAHVPPLAARLDRMAALSEAVSRALAAWRPLSGARVDGGDLVLSFVDAARGVKVEAALALDDLLEPLAGAGVASSARVLTVGGAGGATAGALEAAQAELARAVAAAGGATAAVGAACECVVRLMGQAAAAAAPAAGADALDVPAAPAAVLAA